MSAERVYLDHNATAPVRPAAIEAMAAALKAGGNPSSIHAEGRAARGRTEAAREALAALADVRTSEVFFTSGGTEANALALSPALLPNPDQAILLVSAVEHVCVLEGHRFSKDRVEIVPVTPDGLIDLDRLGARIAAAPEGAVMVALQWANNETGVIQPIAAVAEMVHARKGRLHVDGVQGAGKLAFTRRALGADSVALSAHKLGGPQGVGALILGPGLVIDHKMLIGGGQERGTRAGTENVPGIAAFGAAVREAAAALPTETARLASLRDACEAALLEHVPGAVIFGAGVERLPNTLCFAIPGLKAETALMAFDLGGVALSSGSACSSGKVKRSHVLAAMGVLDDLAACALRLSLGWSSTEKDVIQFGSALEKIRNNTIKKDTRAA
jgi:cysteine desulfurase